MRKGDGKVDRRYQRLVGEEDMLNIFFLYLLD